MNNSCQQTPHPNHEPRASALGCPESNLDLGTGDLDRVSRVAGDFDLAGLGTGDLENAGDPALASRRRACEAIPLTLGIPDDALPPAPSLPWLSVERAGFGWMCDTLRPLRGGDPLLVLPLGDLFPVGGVEAPVVGAEE